VGGPWEWPERIRARIVRQGIQAICGTPDFVSTKVTADIPLISAGLRFAALRVLGALGVRELVAKSSLGYKFVCHIGDLAEFPFYHRRAYEKELAICAGWLCQEDRPVVYDLGANVGFISTHLAQMLASQSPEIYAFEPTPATYAKLVETVRRLGLGAQVRPVAAAAANGAQTVRMAFPRKNSLQAQIVTGDAEPNGCYCVALAAGVALDEFNDAMGVYPALIKMDIEGSEVAALQGAARLLARTDRPAILFEFNPISLAECGATAEALIALLADYTLYYVDDLRGQLLPFGSPVSEIDAIHWICNLFAAPRSEAGAARWASTLAHAHRRLAHLAPRDFGTLRAAPNL
jgi:FkbM family methyltransferase